MPCPPLLLEVLLCRAWAVLSRRLSRALKLLETATLALVSLAESTPELPRRRPHLLARVLRADGGPDEGEGDGVGEGAAAVVRMRESSVRVNLAGNFLNGLSQTNTSKTRMRAAGKKVARISSKRKIKQKHTKNVAVTVRKKVCKDNIFRWCKG